MCEVVVLHCLFQFFRVAAQGRLHGSCLSHHPSLPSLSSCLDLLLQPLLLHRIQLFLLFPHVVFASLGQFPIALRNFFISLVEDNFCILLLLTILESVCGFGFCCVYVAVTSKQCKANVRLFQCSYVVPAVSTHEHMPGLLLQLTNDSGLAMWGHARKDTDFIDALPDFWLCFYGSIQSISCGHERESLCKLLQATRRHLLFLTTKITIGNDPFHCFGRSLQGQKKSW
mmetsp:Transcript_81949/g.144662  ORF Transcript_81949/g.144662 Transcript_81949/m.144662 type:complete len:228 (-) Transcript_81949:875-1558(-)